MAKEMKSFNGYEIVDQTARNDISNIYNNRSIKILNFILGDKNLILAFSGKTRTRMPAGFIIYSDQTEIYTPVPFMLKSDSGSMYNIEDISHIVIAKNDYISKVSETSISIQHRNNWGLVLVIFFSNLGNQIVVTKS